ncbi:MAG: hypothetical protein ACREQV_21695, partial [Candidatus Binatia bacterium]
VNSSRLHFHPLLQLTAPWTASLEAEAESEYLLSYSARSHLPKQSSDQSRSCIDFAINPMDHVTIDIEP